MVRVLASSACGLALVLTAAACGSTEDASTGSTITIAPQSYQSKPAASAAPDAPVVPTADAEGRTDQVQEYTIKQGEYPSQVADDFEVSLDELLNFNDMTLEGNIVPDWPSAGGVVKIPPGAKFIDPTATTTTVADEDDEDEETSTAGTSSDGAQVESTPEEVIDDASADRCVPGKYTLDDGDYPGAVAAKFDVTPDALAAANASTPNYNLFIVGSEIIIPAADDC